ncbi:MAG: hypothetical protein H6737_07975 [Alphaproteobacteria bacterium]|nr:hypothetical protein [Alphaproteobacteria bacterium]
MTSPEAEFREAVEHARGLREAGRFEEAGHAYARAGAMAVAHGAEAPARLAWGEAGEAFRRADRVVEARDALRVALAQGAMSAEERALLAVRLSACLTELGNGDAAMQLLDSALDGVGPGSPVFVLVQDARVGTLLGWGDIAAIEPELAPLEPNAWAHDVRMGQWLRMAGRLDEADARFAAVEAVLEGVPGAEAGLGGVRGERAEIAALQGDPQGSAEAWAAAGADHEAAGRTSLAWRCEAGRVRCLVEAGLAPFPNRLDQGLAWAGARQLATLGIDLGLAEGIAKGDAVRLSQVRDRAEQIGLKRRAGRAELARAALLDGMARMAPLQRAIALLEGDVPYVLRARLLHAETLAGVSRPAGVTAAQRLLGDLRAAGMAPELQRVQALMEA